MSATDPYFTDNGVSRTVDLFYRTTDPSNTDLGDFSLKTAGAGLSFGVPFTEYDTVFFGLRYEHSRLDTYVDSPQSYIDYVQQLTNNVDSCNADPTTCNTSGQSNSVIGTVGWQRDSRDSALTPTRGRYQRVNVEATVPLGALRYYRASYQQTYYYPINQNYTLSVNGEFDYGRGFDGRKLPIFKNFYAGGIGSVRGFDTSTLGPVDSTGNPIGGAKRVNLNAELLFPLPGTGKDRSFRGFIFGDTGGVFAEGQKIQAGAKTINTINYPSTTDPNTGLTTTVPGTVTQTLGSGIKYSVGFGLNWLSPLGALRVSYAVPLHTKPGDHLQRLQFTIGNGF